MSCEGGFPEFGEIGEAVGVCCGAGDARRFDLRALAVRIRTGISMYALSLFLASLVEYCR